MLLQELRRGVSTNSNLKELANTAWAFARVNHEAPSLFDAIARATQARIGDFNPQALANTAWAFATLNHEAQLLFEAIAKSCTGTKSTNSTRKILPT
jgi:hypothetical protein